MLPNQVVYVMIGYAGAGKSTYAKWLASKLENCAILEGDVLKTAKKVEAELKYKLNEGKNVIVDACNTSLKRRAPLIQQCKQRNLVIYGIYFRIPIEICKERAKQREAAGGPHIPSLVYNKLKSEFVAPTLEEGFAGILFIDN